MVKLTERLAFIGFFTTIKILTQIILSRKGKCIIAADDGLNIYKIKAFRIVDKTN